VAVCPVNCIHGPIDVEGAGEEVENMSKEELIGKQLYINPDECINCAACIPECPVDAIVDDEQEAIDMGELESVKKNYEFFGLKYE
jgi:ferredoxin